MKMNSCSAFKKTEDVTSLLLQENCGFKSQLSFFIRCSSRTSVGSLQFPPTVKNTNITQTGDRPEGFGCVCVGRGGGVVGGVVQSVAASHSLLG